jgi:hypothetical protein
VAESSTHEHRPPARRAARDERPALVMAFPISTAAPLPAGEPVGRAWLSALGAPDSEVSGKHLSVTRLRGGGVQVADAGSRNGTWVDGARLGPNEAVTLTDGATLRIGRSVFVYRERFRGPLAPSPPLGRMVGPYGLRTVADVLEAWRSKPPTNALIIGESGTGKELMAEELARVLGRGAPVAVNVGAVPATLFEGQLFGHVAGAFSDARKASRGVVLAADGGVVFLDEIGELALDLQPKLLRLLENREVQPVGAERPQKVDVVIVAATHQPLEARVEAGTFRRDLYARLATAVVQLPPLRDRVEDLFAILQAVAAARGESLPAESIEVEALERLMTEPLPGNVRELVALYGRLRLRDPEPGLRQWALSEELGAPAPITGRALTRDKVDAALAASGGNESEAARLLGCSRGALRRFLSKA